jgi:hypothetical protein
MSESTEAVALLDLRGVGWQLVADVSGQRVLSMFKDQAVHFKDNSSWSPWLLKIRPMCFSEIPNTNLRHVTLVKSEDINYTAAQARNLARKL